jgi:hypothetical protein
MTKKELTTRMFERLMNEPFAHTLKWVKSENLLVQNHPEGLTMVEFYFRQTISDKTNELAYIIEPVISRQFYELKEWFAPFTYITKKDQKYRSTIMFDIDEIGYKKDAIYFEEDFLYFDETYLLVSQIVEKSFNYLNSTYRDLNDVFEKYRFGFINDKTFTLSELISWDDSLELKFGGTFWTFNALYLIKKFAPSEYDRILIKLKAYWLKLYDEKHYDALFFSPKFDDILESIEKL